jgi:hypothetical protein
MTIFIEIDTETTPLSLNVADIHRITPMAPRADGMERCHIACSDSGHTAIGKSYAAIMALLMAAGATTIMKWDGVGEPELADPGTGLTHHDKALLANLALDALPQRGEAWGAARQIEAQNAFFGMVRRCMSDDDWESLQSHTRQEPPQFKIIRALSMLEVEQC